MVDIFINRRIGRHKAGDIVHNVELDAYWNAHIEAANALLLEPLPPVIYADDDEDFLITIARDHNIDLDSDEEE